MECRLAINKAYGRVETGTNLSKSDILMMYLIISYSATVELYNSLVHAIRTTQFTKRLNSAVNIRYLLFMYYIYRIFSLFTKH